MKLTKAIAQLIFEMEYLVGQECYNPKSYDGYTGEEGRSFRYPVYILEDEDDGKQKTYKYRGKISKISSKHIGTMKYKFGSNHLYIGNALVNVLNELEKRYGIDFNELEKQRNKK